MILKRLVLLLMGMILMACNAVSTVFQGVDAPTSPVEMTTYRSEEDNFELDYPAGWYFEAYHLGDMVLSLTSFELGSLPDAEYIPPEHSKIDILMFDMPPAESFKNVVLQEAQELDCIIEEPNFFSLDEGGQAVELIVNSEMAGRHSIVYADLEGRYFIFSAFANLSPVHDIVRSLRPITPSGENGQQETFDELPLTVQDECYI